MSLEMWQLALLLVITTMPILLLIMHYIRLRLSGLPFCWEYGYYVIIGISMAVTCIPIIMATGDGAASRVDMP